MFRLASLILTFSQQLKLPKRCFK